jgi:hypothetical protein
MQYNTTEVSSSVGPDLPPQADKASHQPLASLLMSSLALTGRGQSMYPLTAILPTNISNFATARRVVKPHMRNLFRSFEREMCIRFSVDAEILVAREFRLQKFQQ